MKNLFAVSLLVAAAVAAAQSSSDDCADPSSASLDACTAPASEGLAAVKVGGKWGFVGLDGQMTVPPKFDAVGRYSQGRAAASLEGAWGYIDKQGHWLVAPRFLGATAFSEDRAFARDERGAWHLIGLDGQPVAALGSGAQPLPYDPTGASLMVRGRAAVQLPPSRLLVSQHGVTPLPPGAAATDQPREGLVPAALDEGMGKFGYLDLQGQWAIEPQYDSASAFVRGRAAVSIGDRSWLINRKGDKLVDLGAATFVASYHDAYWGVWRDGEMHFLHADGTPAAFDRATLKASIAAAGKPLEEHYDVRAMPPIGLGAPLALLEPKEGVKQPLGLIDARGRIVFNEEWLSFIGGVHSRELPLVVETLGGYGAIDGKGQWVVQPLYDHVGLFERGRARIRAGENAGFAFATGRLMLPPPGIRWQQVHDDMTAAFELRDGREGVVSMQTGAKLWESQGRVYAISDTGKTYSEEVDELEGIRKADGSWLLRPECERLAHLTGDAWLCRDQGGRRHLVDAQGTKTPVWHATETLHGWLLHGSDRSGVLFRGREPVWFDRALWTSGDDARNAEFVSDEALIVQQPGRGFAVVDAQGRVVSTHKAEELNRLALQPRHLLLQGEASIEILEGTPRAWAGRLMSDAMVETDDIVTAEMTQDGRYETVVRKSDGSVRARLEGVWGMASPRWLARLRGDDAPSLEFHNLSTGRRLKAGYSAAHPTGSNAIAVRDDEHRWGWVDDTLKTVVKPAYTEIGRFSLGVVWVRTLESLDLLDSRGQRLGRVSYECGHPQWVPATGKKAAGC